MPFVYLFGKNLCAMRDGQPFRDSMRAYSNARGIDAQHPCPQFFKLCGSGSNETSICVNQEHECPINDFFFAMPNEQVPQGYESIELT